MGVDPRLLDLCLEANRDEMYVLSSLEAKAMMVANNGRQPPEWSVAASPRGARLQGRQATIDGNRTVSFSCDGTQTVFGAEYEFAPPVDPSAASTWRHLLTIGRSDAIPVEARSVSGRDGVVHSTFVLPPNLVRLAMSARHIGYRMKLASNRVPSIDYRVDVDGRSAATVRRFLGDCLRRAK